MPWPAAHEVEQRLLLGRAPALLDRIAIIPAAEVVDDHGVIGRQRARARAAEFLGDAHLEATGVLEHAADGVVGAAPVVLEAVAAADDQDLEAAGIRAPAAPAPAGR